MFEPRTRVAFLLFAMAAACGTDPGTLDAGAPADGATGIADAGGNDARSGPAAPTPVAVPVLLPCPPGWSERVDEGIAWCDPFPAERSTCPPGEAQLVGTATCAPIGTECPLGDIWPEALPSMGQILYVRSGASAGGDGSRGAPFGTIAAALEAATSGAVIALSKGEHAGQLEVSDVTLRGACVAETTVTSSAVVTGAIFEPVSGTTRIENLRIVGPGAGVFVQVPGAEVALDGVLVEGATYTGVGVVGDSTIAGRRVVIRDTGPSVTSGNYGFGLAAVSGGHVQLSEVVISAAHMGGIVADGEGSSIVLSDAIIEKTRQIGGRYGFGVNATRSAHVSIERTLISENAETGIATGSASTSVSLIDVIVRDTVPRADGHNGGGISVHETGSLVAERVVVERNRMFGILVNTRAEAWLEDVIVRDTENEPASDGYGRGMQAQQGGRLRGLRVSLLRNRNSGVFANGEGTLVDVDDLDVWATRPRANSEWFGRGLEIYGGARVTGARMAFRENHDMGLFVWGSGSRLDISDVVVRDTQPKRAGLTYGRGLNVVRGASARVERAIFADNRNASVFVGGASTAVDLWDVVIEGTRPAGCQATTCADEAAGTGVVVIEHGSARLRGFIVRTSALAGIQLARGGEVDLEHGEVSSNPVGVNVQTEGFDLGRLQNDVTYRDNGTNLDTRELTIPDPGSESEL